MNVTSNITFFDKVNVKVFCVLISWLKNYESF